jgi:hypothetical protein
VKSPKKTSAINATRPKKVFCLKLEIIKSGRVMIDVAHRIRNIHFQSDWQFSPANIPIQNGIRTLINGALFNFSSTEFIPGISG